MSRRLAAVLVGAVAAVTLSAVPAQAASSTMGPGLDLKAGAHHPISRTIHAGTRIVAGHKVVCLSYGADLGVGPVTKGTDLLVMPGAEAAARGMLLANTYADTTDNHVAARLWAAEASIIKDNPAGQPTAAGRVQATNLRADWSGLWAQLTPSDQAGVTAMLDLSKTHAPYKVTVAVGKTVPGQTGKATATVTGSDGRVAKGAKIAWTVVGGKVSSTGATGVSYVASALSQTVSATATMPSSSSVYVTATVAGKQKMIGAGFIDTANGSACATVCPVSAAVTVHAQCDDKGRHEVDITFTAENLPGNYQGTIDIGGHASTVEVAPGETRTVNGVVSAGQDVTVGYQILDQSGTVLVTSTLDSFTQR